MTAPEDPLDDDERPESDGSEGAEDGSDDGSDDSEREREREREREQERDPGSDFEIDVEDGAGCVEIWERLSESRSDDES
ncbi:hypothetical protein CHINAEXTREME_06025 [Halobiforma lacisalsi AJ5]|uniref:Uncharacterized protein n=1 Tax=Natronobacterium lacisalsi AJ5 TaxID=358396 RepID=M0LXJ6_NATLA|nr:hypothetical protein [Halobiforma lacisalsi]APW97351.1 hypothetical protein CHINAEXTREME_06025 [Halobiforma lacisalsi AJ5]EMA37898.1 hypothetical protein C445_00585 [Halobiforma lacisalsi AJ5]